MGDVREKRESHIKKKKKKKRKKKRNSGILDVIFLICYVEW